MFIFRSTRELYDNVKENDDYGLDSISTKNRLEDWIEEECMEEELIDKCKGL